MAVKISALILTKNEEDLISDAIGQLDFVDEVIVLDQSSQDKTVKLARKFTDKIYQTKSGDFAQNRNLLASHAKGEWLLYVDCDERLTESLVGEIQDAIKNSKFSAYYIPRQNFLLGKWQKHGGWWPDYVPRLIRSKSLIAWQGKVHESLKVEGEVGYSKKSFAYFKNPLVHLTARSVSQILEKSIKWAKIEAQLYYQRQNPKVTIAKVLKAASSQFISRYFLKLGILDGTIGLISAIYQSLHSAAVFTYLWEIQNRESV